MRGGELVRLARRRAGVSQAQLARRLGTKQPVVARWETGSRSPDYDTVLSAVRACGFDLSAQLLDFDPQEEAQIQFWLSMTPLDRLAANQSMLDTEEWARSARVTRRLRDES